MDAFLNEWLNACEYTGAGAVSSVTSAQKSLAYGELSVNV